MTDVIPTSANLWAKINPGGLNTAYRFEYLSETAYEANLSATLTRGCRCVADALRLLLVLGGGLPLPRGSRLYLNVSKDVARAIAIT